MNTLKYWPDRCHQLSIRHGKQPAAVPWQWSLDSKRDRAERPPPHQTTQFTPVWPADWICNNRCRWSAA